MSSPSLLWVTPEPPDRSLGGGSIRQSHLLEAVGRELDVDVIAIGGRLDDRTEPVVRHLEEIPEPHIRRPPAFIPGSVRVAWENEFLRMTSAVADTRLHRKALAPLLRERSAGYDLVHLEHDRLAPLAADITAPARTITLHNLRSEQARQRLVVESSAPRRWLARRAGKVARRFEQQVVRDFNAVFVSSPADAGALDARAHVVPNGVDVQQIRAEPVPAASNLVFVGRLDWQPNVEGLQWFFEHVLPRVRALVPEVRMEVVGMNPVAEVLELAGPGIAIHPNVDSTIPYLHRGRVAVVPLHVGSGTRLKALEAMAAGRPVVGTGVGLAGLGLASGVQAEIVDDPRAMADAVARLLHDDQAAAEMAAAARRHVETHFDWSRIAAEFAQTLRSIAEARRG
jgi:glycosyltransferase involved in cell wall biosynthesis